MWRFELRNGRYGEAEELGDDGMVVSSTIPGFSAPLADLLPQP